MFRRVVTQARADAGLSQRQLATKLGIGFTTVSEWERGTSAPREDTAARLEHVLGLEEGTLGRMLGFIPYGVQLNAVSSVTEALEADQRLGPRERDLLETMYRELVKQRDQARADDDDQPAPSARSSIRSRNSASN